MFGKFWFPVLGVAAAAVVACTRAWGISAVYSAFVKDPAFQNAFLDVASGTNTFESCQGYTAKAGLDTPSGIGIPMGGNAAAALCRTGMHAFGCMAAINAYSLVNARRASITWTWALEGCVRS